MRGAVFVIVVLSVVVGAALAQPAYITWPIRWHATVLITNPPLAPFAPALPVTSTGSYYYDATLNSTSSSLQDAASNTVLFRELLDGVKQRVYLIDSASGVCSSSSLGSLPRYTFFPVDFLSVYGFTYIGQEYFLTADNVF